MFRNCFSTLPKNCIIIIFVIDIQDQEKTKKDTFPDEIVWLEER